MDLADVQKTTQHGYGFGEADPAKLAASLRRIADDIEAKRTIVTDIRLIQRSTTEDFYFQTLILRFSERTDPPTYLPSINA